MPDNKTRLADRLSQLPMFRLVHCPTPLEGSTLRLGGARIHIKRDDCTGLALGGNKTRKLEFTIGDALAEGATSLVTASSIQSNHVRQTAAAAARAGLSFHGVVAPTLERFPRAHLDSGNLLLDCLLGATIHAAPSEDQFDSRVDEVVTHLSEIGERPYVIPLGASDGTGSVGYVACALELLDQIAGQSLDISHLFVATGSGGTHAGLLAGLRLMRSDIRVIGISVSDPAPVKCQKVRDSLSGIEDRLGLGALDIGDDEIVVFDAYVGEGYAHPTASANDWIVRLARSEGVLLDPVYTGKAWAGMADLLETGRIEGVRDVVFVHTGGVPALFADPRLLNQTEVHAAALAPFYGRVTD